MLVYRVIFPNGKSYIGITTRSMEERRRRHFHNAFTSKLCTHFYNALRKYKDQITWMVIDKADTVEELKSLERKYISEFESFSSGYNRTLGGEGISGYKFSELSKSKMSAARRGVPKSEGFKEKMRGKKKGVLRSQATKDKISLTLKNGGAVRGSQHSKWRGFVNTPFGKFSNIKEASEHSGCCRVTVFNRCKSEKFKEWFWSKNE